MRVGIFGLPYAGKTSVFGCLAGDAGSSANPKKRAEGTNGLGVVKVPDRRVDYLARIYEPKKTTYAEILFADMVSPRDAIMDAGTVASLRTMDVVALVLRAFESPMVSEEADPVRDFRLLEDEMLLADLAVVEKRLDRLARENGNGVERRVLTLCRAHLEEEKPLRTLELSPSQLDQIKGYAFLSIKNLLVLSNTPEEEVVGGSGDPTELTSIVEEKGGSVMPLCASIEQEIASLDSADQRDFLADLGLESSSRDRFIRHAFDSLSLISFLTSGKDECRAWPVRRGVTARKAAGTIHSDIERGFIRAEVLSFRDFERCGGCEKEARSSGRYRLEGKDYLVEDGDIVNFRFNV